MGHFAPITTSRLTLRPAVPADAESLIEWRNDPRVAEYETWTLPYEPEQGHDLIKRVIAQGGPENDTWWMLVATENTGDDPVGEIAFKPTWGGRSVEVGYTLAPRAWGRGYAVEAVDALIDRLVEDPQLTRIWAMAHPDNIASVQVMERVGMVYEGRTKQSFWVGDENSDDIYYGMTVDDRRAWLDRPRTRPDEVRLVELGLHNDKAYYRLSTHHSQRRFASTVADSYADALFPEEVDGAPVVPWMRGIEADGQPVGFVMLAEITDHHPEPFLWRLLIDRLNQRRGVASMALDLVEDQCRAWGAATISTSWTEGRGSPRPFYEARGYAPTGELIDGETEGRKVL